MGEFRIRTSQIRVNLAVDPSSEKRKEISRSGFKSKKAAESALNKLILEIELGNFVEDKKILVKDLLELWLDTVKSTVEPNTYLFYEDISTRVLAPNL